MDYSPLDEREKQLMDALRSLGAGWHTRAELAAQLGKARLNASEITLLEVAARQGQIEIMTRPAKRPNISEYLYKVKE
jgi:hypothetical protein